MTTDPFADYPHRTAVVDLGSNSVKLVCYSADRTGAYRPYHRESFRMRLDEHDSRIIRGESVARLLDILQLFWNIIQHENIGRVLAVATSAVRGAENRESLITQIRAQTGFDFTILSGPEEALYSYTGAATHLDIPNCIFFDIGGGSLEIVAARNHAILYADSLRLGSLVTTRKFTNGGDIQGKSIHSLRKHIHDSLPSPESLGPLGNDAVLVGVGGMLRAIARYAQAYLHYPLKKIHNYTMDARLVHDITTEILSHDISTLSQMYEIGRGRADIIKAGSLIVEGMLDRFGFDHIHVSSTGLREGVLAFANRYGGFDMHDISHYMVREMVRSPSWMPRIPTGAAAMVRTMVSSELLSGEEKIILRAAAANLNWLRTFRDADDFLYRILDDTSSLPHRTQLLSALCLAYAKKPKRTMLLMKRYDPVLHTGDYNIIRKISPTLPLCDILIRAGAKADIILDPDHILLNIHTSQRSIPESIMQQRCQRAGHALNTTIEYVYGADSTS